MPAVGGIELVKVLIGGEIDAADQHVGPADAGVGQDRINLGKNLRYLLGDAALENAARSGVDGNLTGDLEEATDLFGLAVGADRRRGVG